MQDFNIVVTENNPAQNIAVGHEISTRRAAFEFLSSTRNKARAASLMASSSSSLW